VVGAEAAFTSSAISGSTTVPALAAGTQERATSNPQWLVTATGRAGYAASTLLIYVKGGAAWMHAEYTQETLVPPSAVVFATSKLNATRTGFVAGAGLEYGMTENFSAKAEYDFYDFGTANYTFNVGGVVMPVSIKSDIHVFTVGLNYRWNWVGGWHW
jgi:outer membrane immunogenic protein